MAWPTRQCSSEAKYTASEAYSKGWPRRPSGIIWNRFLFLGFAGVCEIGLERRIGFREVSRELPRPVGSAPPLGVGACLGYAGFSCRLVT
jgi:hypothetical protein